MSIVLNVIGQTKVYYVSQVVHIQSTGSHIGSNQQLQLTLAELVHGQVTLRLRKVSVQRIGVVAVLHQLVGNLLRLQAGTAENDCVYGWVIVNNAFQGQVLVLGVNHIIDVLHVLGALITCADDNLAGIMKVFL